MSCTYTKKTKLSEIVGDDTNNEGVEKHKKKILAQKHINWL